MLPERLGLVRLGVGSGNASGASDHRDHVVSTQTYLRGTQTQLYIHGQKYSQVRDNIQAEAVITGESTEEANIHDQRLDSRSPGASGTPIVTFRDLVFIVLLLGQLFHGEIKKLEVELWNLKVKGNDVPAYTETISKS
ncbi:hypothetical protein Tco_1404265 [Tanacetum coccineum]